MARTIANIAKVIGSGLTPLRSNPLFWNSPDISWLKTEQLGAHVIYDTKEYISRKAMDETSIKLWPPHTVSIAMYGEGKTRGNVSIIMSEMTTNQACCNVIVDDSLADYRFLYYCLKYNYEQLRSLASGVRKNLNSDDIKNFPFPDFGLDYQISIAQVLSSIDDRIDNNNKICTELESMAKTLYDYWFVQFDFPDENGKPYRTNGGRMKKCSLLKTDIPTDWNICSIEEACDIIDCLHSKKPEYKYEDENYYLLVLENLTKDGYIDVSQKYYISGSDYGEWTSRIEVKENDFVMTNAGRAGDIGKIPAGIKCAIGRNLTAIHPRKINAYYLREFFKSIFVDQQIQSGLDTGSFFKSFNVRSIKKLSILLPDEETMDRYVGIVTPIIRRIEAILSENQELVKMRDWLLPMLMNGQVKVMDANKEEVPIAEETTASTDDPRFVEWLNM